MKQLVAILVFLFIGLSAYSQTDKLKENPIFIDKDLVVVGISAKTTDAQLLNIRKTLLKNTSIRFVNFDVVRCKEKSGGFFKKKKLGDICFFSMEVDCRDGFNGAISHSFEKGDMTIYGFYRDYKKNTYKKAFFIGDLTQESIDYPLSEIKQGVEGLIE